MRKTLTFIVQTIAGSTTKIQEDQKQEQKIFTIFAPKDKIGLLVGKNGKTIKAIKTLLNLKNALVGKKELYAIYLEEKS